MAYFVLPPGAHEHFDKVVGAFGTWGEAAGAYYYTLTCGVTKIEPIKEHAHQFRAYHGELDGAREYFVVGYPTPPPFTMDATDLSQLDPEKMPVLAPHFSAILRHRQSQEVTYYVLGQAPFGGTTLRSVLRNGDNCNLGPGPTPTLEDFLGCLRSR